MPPGKLNPFVSSCCNRLVVADGVQTSRLLVGFSHCATSRLKKACVSATNREGQGRADPAAAVAALDHCD
jgi:hypothetical protein